MVLVELVWVLETVYGYDRQLIAHALRHVVTTAEFAIDAADEAHAAIRAYAEGSADFADCLIGKTNSAAGWTPTGTFDRRAARLAEFVLVEDDAEDG